MDEAHKIIVVDDEPGARERLGRAVTAHPHLQLLASAASLAEGRSLLQQHQARVILVDLGLPDGSGLELIHEATQLDNTDCMVISVFGDEQHVLAALEAGATGYLLKDSMEADVGQEIINLIDGGSPISPKIARHLLKRFQHAAEPSNKNLLTERELAVLELVAKGYKRQEIADRLNISLGTVGTHINKVYKKLAVSSNIEAVREAMKRGLL